MKKIKIYFTRYTPPLLLTLFILFISVCASAQKKTTTGIGSVSAAYKKACGDFPNSGTSIYSNSTLTAGEDCNTTISESSSTVYFTAREKIIFYPGFKAAAGSNFIARIDSTDLAPARISEPAIPANEFNVQGISVSPNPFTGNIITLINSEKACKATVSVYNSQGSKIKVLSGVNLSKGVNKITFNYSDLAPGVYMLEINSGDTKIVKKIIKAGGNAF